MIIHALKQIHERLTGKVPLRAPLRSKHWPTVEKQFRAIQSHCQACPTKKTKGLNVHHKKPFHLFPAEELNLHNLITLCRRCHQAFGHCDNWKDYNENVEVDSDAAMKMFLARKVG